MIDQSCSTKAYFLTGRPHEDIQSWDFSVKRPKMGLGTFDEDWLE